MSLSAVDERELLVPIVTGITERPAWETFVRRLLARTRAHQACLLVRAPGAEGSPVLLRRKAADPADPPPEFTRLETTGLVPLATMRPNRVYALQETVSPTVDARRLAQRAALADGLISHARFLRVPGRSGAEAWLFISHRTTDFTGADSALLSALAPHLSAALDLAVALDALRLRAAMAEDALALIGVQQAAVDREGRPVEIGPEGASVHGRFPIAPRDARDLAEACRGIAGRPAGERRFVSLGPDARGRALLRPGPGADTALPSAAVAVLAGRSPRRGKPPAAARILAQELGLSQREAALAEAISRGLSIVEAGAALQLTPETARNYTKRIYAKTGATGQADLVRMVLTGLAPLA